MRKLSLLVVLCCAPWAIAEDKAKQDAASAPNPAAKVTAAKPVIEETPKVVRAPELHEHPTIVQMLHKNNEFRGQVGLGAHRLSPELTKAAQDHANYMAATGSFSHYSNGSPGGRAMKYGYNAGVLENIAMGYSDVGVVFNGWRASGGHWANMTSSTNEAGFGYAIGAGGSPYWVAVYGNGPAISQVVASQPASQAPSLTTAAATTAAAPASVVTSVPASSIRAGMIINGELVVGEVIVREIKTVK